jgi:hypothetical protein
MALISFNVGSQFVLITTSQKTAFYATIITGRQPDGWNFSALRGPWLASALQKVTLI